MHPRLPQVSGWGGYPSPRVPPNFTQGHPIPPKNELERLADGLQRFGYGAKS